eukprot:4288750-Alexandrium_andersonii.AAC.1
MSRAAGWALRPPSRPSESSLTWPSGGRFVPRGCRCTGTRRQGGNWPTPSSPTGRPRTSPGPRGQRLKKLAS